LAREEQSKAREVRVHSYTRSLFKALLSAVGFIIIRALDERCSCSPEASSNLAVGFIIIRALDYSTAESRLRVPPPPINEEILRSQANEFAFFFPEVSFRPALGPIGELLSRISKATDEAHEFAFSCFRQFPFDRHPPPPSLGPNETRLMNSLSCFRQFPFRLTPSADRPVSM